MNRSQRAASATRAGEGNDKTPAECVNGLTSYLSVPEILDAEINAWIAREQAADPSLTRRTLLDALGRELDLDDARGRQLYRYMSGDTPFPAEKITRLCQRIGSWKLLDLLNQEADSSRRDLGPLMGFDLVIEQAHTVKEFGELVAAHADAMDRPITPEIWLLLDREAREVIRQIQRLVANAHRLMQKGLRPGDVQ